VRARRLSWLPAVAIAAAGGIVPLFVALASDPPLPTEARLYGTVDLAGVNLDPVVQPVIALIAGHPCGAGTTFLNGPSESDDPGKTVYVIDVVADGTRANEVPGCGRPGTPVRLYFPASGQMAPATVPFASGIARFNVSLGAFPVSVGARVALLARGDLD